MSHPKFQVLASEIRDEINEIERIVEEISDFLKKTEKNQSTIFEIRILGSQLHDFYTGLERIFHRIALNIDQELPKGQNWHNDLLDRMALDIPKIRTKVISPNLRGRLHEYLRFRQLFRNVYGPKLKWEKLMTLGNDVGEIFNRFKEETEKFLQFLLAL